MTSFAKPRYSLVAIDCPDPLALAAFYSDLTGLAIEPLEGFPPEKVTWIELLHDGRPTIAFQKVDHFVAPTWPVGDTPQQLHLDFDVEDLDEGERFVISLGAVKTAVQPGQNFRVFLDPIGHPFCLVWRAPLESA